MLCPLLMSTGQTLTKGPALPSRGKLVTAIEPLSVEGGQREVDTGQGRHRFCGRVQHQVTFQQALPKARFRVQFLRDQPWAASSGECVFNSLGSWLPAS